MSDTWESTDNWGHQFWWEEPELNDDDHVYIAAQPADGYLLEIEENDEGGWDWCLYYSETAQVQADILTNPDNLDLLADHLNGVVDAIVNDDDNDFEYEYEVDTKGHADTLEQARADLEYAYRSAQSSPRGAR